MKNNRKKNMREILTAAMLVFSLLAGTAFVPDTSVYAQNTMDFTIDQNGVLTAYTGNGGNITIPKNVKKIGKSAFSGCKSIYSVKIPDTVTVIESAAFDSCSSLKSVQLPDKLTTIEDSTFWGCTALKSITLPSSVKTIGFGAFGSCDSLNGVYIPKTVTKIGNYAFGFLFNGEYIPVRDFAIMGQKNSAAQEYADKYSVPFLTKDSLKTSISSVSKKSGNKLVVKWKKNTKVSGYEIQYSTSSKFASSKTKTIRVGKASATSKAISKIKEGTTYYVRIRGYRTISGKKYYSSWGKVLKK